MIIIPILLILIIMSIFFIKPYIKMGKFMNGKRTYLFLTGYVTVLFIGTLVFVFGHSPQTSLGRDPGNPLEVDKAFDSFFEIADGERSIGTIEQYKKQESEYPFHDDQLKIKYDQPGYLAAMVIVDKTKNLEGMIQVSYYRAPTYAGNMELTSYLKSPDVQVQNEVLTLKEYPNDITVINFEDEFTLRQFSKSSFPSPLNDNIEIGPELIYIQVPEHVEIVSDEYVDILQ